MSFGSRHSIRKKDYDYSSSGAYFVTICTHDRKPLLGKIKNTATELTPCGNITKVYWNRLPSLFGDIELDAFVIMPDHIHGIIKIREFSKVTLGTVVQNFKSVTARKIAAYTKQKVRPVWQRNYYEHIIRNEKALNLIRLYILLNPRLSEGNTKLAELTDLSYEKMEEILSPYLGP